MPDDITKLLLQAGIDTLLAVTMLVMVYFLSRGRGKAAGDDAETDRRRADNDGKLIDAISKNAATASDMKDLLSKAVDLQADAADWHKRHDTSLDTAKTGIEALRNDVKTRSELDGQAIEEFRLDVKSRHEQSLARFDNIDAILKDVTEKVEKLPNTVEDAKKDILAAIEKCRETQTNPVTVNVNPQPTVLLPSEQPAVNVPTSNLLSGDEAASLPLAS